MNKLDIKGTRNYQSKNNKVYLLPYNPYHKCVIKLLPLDILTNIPLAENFDTWIVDSAQENQGLRDKVNELIGMTWLEATKAEKKEAILKLIKDDKPFFLSVLSLLQDETYKPYDLKKDCVGLYRWLEDSKIISSIVDFKQSKLDSAVPLPLTVGFIIEDFRNLIEQQELWRLFWTPINKKQRHVTEFYSQMLFYMISSAWISGQDSKIIIERTYNKESKQLEIIFIVPGQQKIKVQLKHSDNGSLKKGYEAQGAQCTRKNIQCYYVVFDFAEIKSKQLRYILQNEDPLCKIVQIDVAFKHEENDFDLRDDIFDINFGDLTTEYADVDDELYIKEKRKGGESSYQVYVPLREKVKELCLSEMKSKSYSSARSLSHKIAQIVEEKFPDLLKNFIPYINYQRDRTDWRSSTFYNWCNSHFKNRSKPCIERSVEQINEKEIEYES